MERKSIIRTVGTLACAALAFALISFAYVSRAAVKTHGALAGLWHYAQFAATKSPSTARHPQEGSWTTPSSTLDVEVHGALLYTGKVVVWGVLQGGPNPPPPWTPSKLIDPIANTVTDVSPTFDDDFVCAGNSYLPNGNLLVTGGNVLPVNLFGAGVTSTAIFNPATETWTQGTPMNYPRWYPSNVEMSDGTTIVLSGHDAVCTEQGCSSIVQMESYNPTTGVWTVLPPSADNPDGTDTNLLYPRMFLMPSGMLFKGAPNNTAALYNPTTQTWQLSAKMNQIGSCGGQTGTACGTLFYTSHIQVPNTNEIWVFGGTPSNANHGGTYGTTTTQYIDYSQTNPTWQSGPSLNLPRYNQIGLFLADGTVMAVGGNDGPGNYGDPQEESEIYTPGATNWIGGTWATTAPFYGSNTVIRGYHSVAVLLPDGRVLSTGSTSGAQYDDTYQIYSPPYLSNGTRPTITSAPTTVNYGQNFVITTPDASSIASVALIAPTATTHANNMTQRYVPLNLQIGSGNVTATAPANGNWAPPGYYMLVIVSNTGVPSVASWVQIPPAT